MTIARESFTTSTRRLNYSSFPMRLAESQKIRHLESERY